MTKKNDIIIRFWNKVLIDNDDKCWEWTGCNWQGYGRIMLNGKTEKTHRVSWILHFGDIPNEMCVCHKCDNPSCVNPNHLFLATHKENMEDMKYKNRTILCGHKGERNCKAKFTNNEIAEIRKIYCFTMKYRGLQAKMARLYKTTTSSMSKIINGNTWNGMPINPILEAIS